MTSRAALAALRGHRTPKASVEIEDARPFGLVYRPRLVKRDLYLVACVRSWPSTGRSKAISDIRNAKARMDSIAIQIAAQEMAGLISSLLGTVEAGIIAAPRGASKTEKHFATEIANQIAKLTGLKISGEATYQKTKLGEGEKGGFHDHKRVSAIAWEEKPSLAIVVDDVYTTGATLKGLRQAIDGPCLLMAWIGPGGKPEPE